MYGNDGPCSPCWARAKCVGHTAARTHPGRPRWLMRASQYPCRPCTSQPGARWCRFVQRSLTATCSSMHACSPPAPVRFNSSVIGQSRRPHGSADDSLNITLRLGVFLRFTSASYVLLCAIPRHSSVQRQRFQHSTRTRKRAHTLGPLRCCSRRHASPLAAPHDEPRVLACGCRIAPGPAPTQAPARRQRQPPKPQPPRQHARTIRCSRLQHGCWRCAPAGPPQVRLWRPPHPDRRGRPGMFVGLWSGRACFFRGTAARCGLRSVIAWYRYGSNSALAL